MVEKKSLYNAGERERSLLRRKKSLLFEDGAASEGEAGGTSWVKARERAAD